MRAERDRRAAILTAEGRKQSRDPQRRGRAAGRGAPRRGQRKAAAILDAEGEAKAIDTVFRAIHEGDPTRVCCSLPVPADAAAARAGRGEQDLRDPQRVHPGARRAGQRARQRAGHGQGAGTRRTRRSRRPSPPRRPSPGSWARATARALRPRPTSGISARTRVPVSGRAGDLEAAVERADAVGEPAQARARGRPRRRRCRRPTTSTTSRPTSGRTRTVADVALRVLADVRQAFGHDEVGRRLDRRQQPRLRRLDDLRGHRRARRELAQGGGQPAVREHGRVDAAGEVAQLREGGPRLLAGPRRRAAAPCRRRRRPAACGPSRASGSAPPGAAGRRRAGRARCAAARRRPRR